MRKSGRTWKATITVVGLQFRWKKDGRAVLARSCPFPAELVRETDNEHDEHAIRVNIAGDMKLTALRGRQLGYVNRQIAALIAPRMDAGTVEPVKLWITDVSVESGEAELEARFRDVKTGSTKRKTRVR